MARPLRARVNRTAPALLDAQSLAHFHLRRGADAARQRRLDRDGVRPHGDGDDAGSATRLLRQRRARRRRVAGARMRVRRSHDRRSQGRARQRPRHARKRGRAAANGASGSRPRPSSTSRSSRSTSSSAATRRSRAASSRSSTRRWSTSPARWNRCHRSRSATRSGHCSTSSVAPTCRASAPRQRSPPGASVAAESRRPGRRAAATGVADRGSGARARSQAAPRAAAAADRGARRCRRRGGRAAGARAMPRLRLDAAAAVHDAAAAVDGQPLPSGQLPARRSIQAVRSSSLAQAAASAAGAALVREQERLQSLEAGLTKLRGARRPSSRRSARCRRACARPKRIATPTGWSMRSPPGCCSSPCWRPRSGPCGRASAGARAGSTPTPTRRGERRLPTSARPHGRPDLVRHDPCAQGQPASVAMARGAGEHPAGDGTGVDRRPRGDHRARAAVASGAHGRGRRVGQQRRRAAAGARRRRWKG